MNMKYFKLKYILSGILIIVLAVAIILFFAGSLKASTVEYNNIEFITNGFIDVQKELDKVAATKKDDEPYQFELNEEKIVSHNDKYCLLINEKTTVLTLIEKDDYWDESSPTSGKVLYTTASTSGGATSSNVLVNYYGSTNKSGSFDSYSYSVNFEDKTQRDENDNYKRFKYYQLRYLNNQNAVDILYNIGNHSSLYSRFPIKFEREVFENLFIGNTVFYYQAKKDIDNNPALDLTDENGNAIPAKEMKYIGTGVTFSEEAAKYLEEKGATVTPVYVRVGENKEQVIGYYDISNLIQNDKFILKIGVDYNCEGSPVATNPFFTNVSIENLIGKGNGYKYISGDGTTKYVSDDWRVHVEGASPTLELNVTTGGITAELQNLLYGGSTYTTNKNNIAYFDYNDDGKITADEQYVYGGYHAKDENGNYLYDEDGRPVQALLTKEIVDQQNEVFNATDLATQIEFQVCLRVSLTDSGIEARVINESITENNASISSISVFPYMTVNTSNTSKGQIILPDGSGAVISFNSVKDSQQPTKYLEKRLYGSDLTIPLETENVYSRDLMLNMYGFLEQSDKKGLVVIADQGAAQVSVEADFLRSNKKNVYNEVRFIAYLREKEDVQISSSGTHTKLTKDIYPEDFIFKYEVLTGDNLTYVDVAEVYRNYLLEKYDLLEENGDKTRSNNLSINFLGAFTKKQIALGFVYDAEMSLTTFEQAGQIVDDLKNNGVLNMNVSYSFWTEDEMSPEITTDVSVSNELGGKKGLMELASHLKELGVAFYPEYNAVTGSGYDMNYGTLKYSSKSISGSYSEIPSFVLSTGQANAEFGAQKVMSPRFYKALINKYTSNVTKLEINGLLLSNLGSERTADYAKKVQIYSGISTKYQSDALKAAKEELGGVMLSSPFDYALEYASYAINVPTSTTLYPIVDYSIPLYQLVISGLLDYSSEYVNYNNDNSSTYNLLKAIETGSNLSFMLSYEDTSVLLDTNHTGYYNSYYSNWSNEIISMNEELNKSGIYNSRLVYHEYVTDNLVKVQYENGLTILINYDKTTYQDPITGVAVRGNWYAIVEKGA